jgi:hypothetical protein
MLNESSYKLLAFDSDKGEMAGLVPGSTANAGHHPASARSLTTHHLNHITIPPSYSQDPNMSTRPPSKASPLNKPELGWYPGDPTTLGKRLDGYLAGVPDAIDGASLPISGARIVIAP